MLVYVGNANSLDISVQRLDEAGVLTPATTVPIPGGHSKSYAALPLALSPAGDRLFAVVRSAPFAVKAYRIVGEDLEFIASTPLPGGMALVRTDRTGRFLLGASTTERLISSSAIAADGRVSEDHQVIEGVGDIHAILPDLTNRHVYASVLHGDVLLRLSFDAQTGRLAIVGEVANRKGSGPRHMALQPDGKGLYLLNEYDGMIDSYALDPQSGELTLRDTVSIMPANTFGQPRAADLQVTPDGRFIYASERGTNTIAAFRCEAGGKLTPIASYVTENCPRSFAIDPQGRFLLSAGQISHKVKVHGIDPQTGALKSLASYTMGRNPSWVEIAA